MEELIVIVLCLVLNAFFAAYEMAFVSIQKSELRALARAGDKSARTLLELRESPERTLSVIQIGITFVGAIGAAVGGAGAAEFLVPYFMREFSMREITAEGLSVLLVVLPLTYLNVVVGELVPKSLALRSPKKIVLAGAKALFLADHILSPIVSVLERSTKFLLRVFFSRHRKEEAPQEASVEIDSLSPVHRAFVINMANIENKKVRDIYLPWGRVVHVKESDSSDEVAQVVLNSGHTRLPVVNEQGRVVGVLHTKEFMTLRESGEKNWRGIVRPALVVKPADSALGVLRLMQEKRSHMCIVFSAAGERLGIVTLEDVLEVVVGDIFDEDDDGRVRRLLASRSKEKTATLQKSHT